MNKKGFSLIGALIVGVASGVVISGIVILGLHKEKQEAQKTVPIIKNVEECKQYWQKSLAYAEKAEKQNTLLAETSYATESAAYSLLYQNCLKRFGK